MPDCKATGYNIFASFTTIAVMAVEVALAASNFVLSGLDEAIAAMETIKPMVTLHNIFEKMLFIDKPVLFLKGFRESKPGNVQGVFLLLSPSR